LVAANKRSEKAEPKIGLSDRARQWAKWLLEPISRFLAWTGVSPNALTIAGFGLAIVVSVVLYSGRFRLGGLLLIAASAFDALDGSLARYSNRVSRFGAFLDSVLDRYSESVVLMGIALWAAERGDALTVLLVFASIVGSLLVSYTRARAEGLRIECKVGIGTRFERVIVLILGLLLNQVTLVLWVLAVVSNLTAVQRVYHVWRVTRESDDTWQS
jgi:CDP-diacylglycerol---glycerol-3-phosphate 3-phosphatidyltransferase